MGFCRRVRTFSMHHEWVGNLFSLLAVVLLFATIWVSLQYYREIGSWISARPLVNAMLLGLGLIVEGLLFLGLLALGSARPGDEDERCFATFPGRRNGPSPLDPFRHWLRHIENVGKKHR